jgi:hypothetical protein
MVKITPLQSFRIFGWRDSRPILVWDDVLKKQLTFDSLLDAGLRPSELVLLQPDPTQWVAHAGAGLKHARAMLLWPANPFTHMGADLADVFLLQPTAAELLRMGVTYAQLARHGMTEQTERMFKFGEEEWAMLGRPPAARC